MKLAIIAPHNLELANLGDCQFALAQEVNDDNANWYTARAVAGQTVILDHGAFELGRPAFDNEKYMEIAEKIHATDVIAPDVQWNSHATFAASQKFRDWFRSEGHHKNFKLMTVVWSSGPGDFGYWFDYHKSDINPDVFGIGKWYESMYSNGAREQLIKGLFQNFNIKPEQLHALGCPYADEVFRLRNHVRSMDTGIAVKAALRGYSLREHPAMRIPSITLKKLDEGRLYTAKKNAEHLLHAAHLP